MEQLDTEQRERILGDQICDKELICFKAGFEELCKAQDIGLVSRLVCLQKDRHCKYALTHRQEILCQCPVRLFILRELGR